MVAAVKVDVSRAWKQPVGTSRRLLGPKRERCLLEELTNCRRTLVAALARDARQAVPENPEDPRAMSRFISEAYRNQGAANGALESVFQRYFGLRSKLALANTRLVSHVARRYRDRGIAYSDLFQEGFCGLLEAIDRFDLTHQTKLSTYATWWIRQAVQSAVAAGAYPVRLTPRHLRQLAENPEELNAAVPRERGRDHVTPELVQRISAAARPSVPLDETRLSTRHLTGNPELDDTDDLDLEAVSQWMVSLRPRERQVLAYRFGLGGSPCLSLSQVGEVLAVSKERVRQIQDAALKVLRTNASRDNVIDPT